VVVFAVVETFPFSGMCGLTLFLGTGGRLGYENMVPCQVVMYAVVAWGSVRRNGECMTARMTVSAWTPPAAMSVAPARAAARTSFSMEIPLQVVGSAEDSAD